MAQDTQTSTKPAAPWYRHRWPWILMSGPAAAVAAGFYTFYLAKTHADEMVTDDYYKEGKYINMQIERDDEAEKRGISAQVLFNADGSTAKVFASGNFNRAVPLRLSLLHPAKKAYDQTVELNPASAPASGDKTEYKASLQALPEAVHWYVRLEDTAGLWRVEGRWLPSQGSAVTLMPKFDARKDSAPAQQPQS